MGGSFDPPHRGHEALLRSAARQVLPDKILLVPAHQAPLKDIPSAPAADRVRMLRIGVFKTLPAKWRGRTRIDLSEVRRGRRVFTIESLRRLRKKHPSAELHFIAGSDSAASFGSWKKPKELKALATWWTGRRPGPTRKPPPHFHRLKGIFPDISSTVIREELALGVSGSGLAPAVFDYIRERGLYGLDIITKLETLLGKKRFAHTLAVTRCAVALARRHGLDIGKARRAALLHDLGRSIPTDSMAAYVLRNNVMVPAREKTISKRPLLLHSYISAAMAGKLFKVRDPAVLRAIRHHTLGAHHMSALERLLYISDAVSDDRDYPGVQRLRALASRDLDKAFRHCVRQTLEFVRRSRQWVHPMTETLWRKAR